MDGKNTKQLDNANREHHTTPLHGDKLWPEQDKRIPPDDAEMPKSIPQEPHEHGRELIQRVTNPEAPQTSDPNFDKYPETVLVFESGLRIDLTRPLTPDDRDRLRDILATPFAVSTASDPFGTPVSEAENDASQLALREVVMAAASEVADVRGEAVDRSHAEDGYGCNVTVDEAARIARQFRQSA